MIGLAGLFLGLGLSGMTYAIFGVTKVKTAVVAEPAEETTVVANAVNTNNSNINANSVPGSTSVEVAGDSYEAVRGSLLAIAQARGVTDISQIDGYINQVKTSLPTIVEEQGMTEDGWITREQALSAISTAGQSSSLAGTNSPTNSGGGGGSSCGICPFPSFCMLGGCTQVQVDVGGVGDALGGDFTKLNIKRVKIVVTWHF